MKPIHNRMPVILTREAECQWLDPDITDSTTLLSLLYPCPDEYLTAVPVSTIVNNPRNDQPKCVKSILA